MVVIPPASDRGFSPLPEANRLIHGPVKKAWFAVYTAPRHEKSVHAQLTAKQIPSFLPLYSVERPWKNRVRKEVEHPLFPGYLFVHVDASEKLPVVQTSGVVSIIGNGSVPLPVDDADIHALRTASQCASLSPYRRSSTRLRAPVCR